MRESRWYFSIAVLVFLITSMFPLGVIASGDEGIDNLDEFENDSTPTRLTPRYFRGLVMNLTDENLSVPFYQSVTNDTLIVDKDDFSVVGGYIYTFNSTFTNVSSYNTSVYEFEIEVDLDQINYTKTPNNLSKDPWLFTLAPRYGWNVTYNGERKRALSVIEDFENETGATMVERFFENYTFEYRKGYFGNVTFTVIEEGTGFPMRDVGFDFENHPFHQSNFTHNRTDIDGKVTFYDLQVGIDGVAGDNRVKVFVDREHYNTLDGTGYILFDLHANTTTNVTITLRENPLVQTISPADGSTDVETDKERSKFYIRFFDRMDPASINTDSIYIENGTGKVPLSYSWDTNNELLTISPTVDLDYNATHTWTVTDDVRDNIGGRPLWRDLVQTFTTHERKGMVHGTVLINGTTEPAPEGTFVKLDGGAPIYTDEGEFEIREIGDGDHYINVFGPTVNGQQEYLYTGRSTSITYEFDISRGDELEIEDIFVFKRSVVDVQFTVSDPTLTPSALEGVQIEHLVTNEIVTTNEEGIALFQDILVSATTYFRASLQNYQNKQIPVSIPFGTDHQVNVTVEMTQLDLPVTVEVRPAGRLLEEVPRVEIDSFFQVRFDVDMNYETMVDPDNIQIRESGEGPIQIDVRNETMDYSIWNLRPRSPLEYDTEYEIFISDNVADQLGGNPIWKPFRATFTTERLLDARVKGRVLINGRGLEGIPIKVKAESSILAEGTSGPNGQYFINVKMPQPEVTNAHIIANGSGWGLNTVDVPSITLRSGADENITDIDMDRLIGWFDYYFDKDLNDLWALDGNIRLVFSNPIGDTDSPDFANNFSLEQGNDNIPIQITVSQDNRTVTVDPTSRLDYQKDYLLEVSYFESELDREMYLEDGRPALIRGERITISTSLKPLGVRVISPLSTSDVELDETITLLFENHTVNEAALEGAFELFIKDSDIEVTNLEFTWKTRGQSVDITHPPFLPNSVYVLRIRSGAWGEGGAMLFSDFHFNFTTRITDSYDIDSGGYTFPAEIKIGKFSFTFKNPLGRDILTYIWIIGGLDEWNENTTPNWKGTIPPEDPTDPFIINLDLSNYTEGSYEIYMVHWDPVTMVKLDEFRTYVNLKESVGEEDTEFPLWAIILLVVIVLLVIVLAGYLYMSGKKKEDIEEVKTEFECPECHNIVSEDDAVCPHCGAEFEEEAYKCPKCGEMLDPEDEVCPECGYDFSDQDTMELEEDEELEEEDITMEDEEMEDEEVEMDEEDEEMEELEVE